MRKVSQKIQVHPFEEKILQSYDLAKKEMFTKNYETSLMFLVTSISHSGSPLSIHFG